ncbi:MAG: heparan-alpha-glucosaminide N-acetyltransferase domain-containing protein [Candidatus Methanomethylicus sp.]|nr:heparan-alpha-glucosaminide N-acetyltransferase domain-containing protein [Candidatus Methanomethylicus sp.]
MKRSVSVDLFRGVAILSVMFVHGLGVILVEMNPQLANYYPVWRAPGDPLASSDPVFFFVTGMSMILALQRRKESQSLGNITGHSILRAAAFTAVGIITSLSLDGTLDFFLKGREPVSMLGITDLVVLPLLIYFSWKKLAVASVAIYAAVSAILIWLPSSLPLSSVAAPITISGPFSILKMVPVVLASASLMSYILAKGRIAKKWLLALGFGIFVLFLVGTFIDGRSIEYTRGIYYFAFPVVLFEGFAAIALLRLADERGWKPLPFLALARSAIWVYFGHMLILSVLLKLALLPPNYTTALILSVLSVAILWPLTYVYAKLRWKDFKDQY